jgi:hypothetical protein
MSHDPHLDLAAVLACDVTGLGTAEAVAMHQRVRRLRGLLDGFEADLTNQLDALYRQGRTVSASDVTSRQQHVSAAEARRRERRAKASRSGGRRDPTHVIGHDDGIVADSGCEDRHLGGAAGGVRADCGHATVRDPAAAERA